MEQIRVLIVDDNFVARRGLRSYLGTESGIMIAGEASTGREAVTWLREKSADVVLMDVRMPDMDGIHAAAEALRIRPQVRVLMLTMVEEQGTVLRALLAGASGYLVYATFTPEELVQAIYAVSRGEKIFRPPLAPALLQSVQEHLRNARNIADMEEMEPLTAREKQILDLIALGKGNRAIGDILDIEEKTVKNHINNIYSKLQIKTRYEAIAYMFRK